jgi:hypothetical protein
MRMAARTAVVAGTATAVSNRVSRRQQGRWADQEQQAYEHQYYEQSQQAAAQPQPMAPAAPPPPDTATQLKQLADLKAQGILTEQEFAAQKAKILGT